MTKHTDDTSETAANERHLAAERIELLQRLDDWLETPMVILGFAWLGLLIVELIWGLSALLDLAGKVIWGIFIAHFVIGFLLAPKKRRYVTNNWLTLIALIVPALRVLRVFRLVSVARAARAARGLRLLRLFTSLNRGMRALSKTMSRRGFGYVVALTIVVTLLGAAGMYAFERDVAGGALKTYGSALWWTAMIMVTMGSDYWPQTPEGRALCFGLALYAFAVFGYVTATLASFFIGRDAQEAEGHLAGGAALEALRAEIVALRADVQQLPRKNV